MLPAAAAGTVRLGDLTVNRIGFGAMRVCGPDIWGPPKDRGAAHRVLRRAVELGVNFFDTADSYGPEVDETLIAEALHPYLPGLVIGTKGGLVRPTRHAWDPDGRPDHLRRALDGSLKRLKLERIDLYQLHAPDPKVPYEDSVGALKELQDEGKVRWVGISNATTDQIEEAAGIVDLVAVQNQLALEFTSPLAKGELRICDERGIAFLPWSPLGGIGKAGEAPGGHDPVAAAAEAHGVSPQQVALAWLLSLSPTVIPIPGASRPESIADSARAAELELTPDELAAVGEIADVH